MKGNKWAGTGSSLLFSLLVLGQAVAEGQSVPPEVLAYPEMVFYNGRVYTADDSFTVAQAVAVRGNQFLAVGSDAEVLRLAGPSTQKVDLRGRSIVPGLFDTHLHQAWVGVGVGAKQGTSGVRFTSVESGLEEVRRVVAGAKPGEWIYLSGPDNKALLQELKLEQLDRISPANPILFTTLNNLAFANSLALQEVDGEIGGVEKDPLTGKPTGVVGGFALGALSYDRKERPGRASPKDIESQKDVLKRLNSQGLTTIIGRAAGGGITVLKAVWERNQLTARVRFCVEITRQNAQTEAYLRRLGDLSGFGDGMMKIIGTTVQPVDGTGTAGAVFTNIPKRRELPDSPFGAHGQNKYENWGSTRETSEYDSILLANRYGWNIACVHNQGDASADLLLEAFEQANKEAPLKGTWAFDHGLFRSPENIAKAKQLGIIFSIAPKYLFQDSPTSLTYQFAEAVHRLTPVRGMIDAGLKPVMESDITGDYSAPLWNMQGLVTRTDEKGMKWGEDQKITRQEALWMKTNWAARYSGDEKILGTIAVGKLADLVVLGEDYMTVPENQISKIPIDLTMVDGKVVYDRAKQGPIRSERWDRGDSTWAPLAVPER